MSAKSKLHRTITKHQGSTSLLLKGHTKMLDLKGSNLLDFFFYYLTYPASLTYWNHTPINLSGSSGMLVVLSDLRAGESPFTVNITPVKGYSCVGPPLWKFSGFQDILVHSLKSREIAMLPKCIPSACRWRRFCMICTCAFQKNGPRHTQVHWNSNRGSKGALPWHLKGENAKSVLFPKV